MTSTPSDVDVLIVGAGISGIGAAYHLKKECPGKTFAILERRSSFGGTWDLFRYPGIRSDSDMHTFGYAFHPWKKPEVVASGDAILDYLRETIDEHGIEDAIQYGQTVTRASWSSRDARWTVSAVDEGSQESRTYTCNFLCMCSGYYDYDEGYMPEFEGVDDFEGEVVHPQKWTDAVGYEGKRIIVIGSGATAVTLIPELAKAAKHVTMLQRSPTYIAAKPNRDRFAAVADALLPKRWAYTLTRWKNILVAIFIYRFCQTFPKTAKAGMLRKTRKALGPDFDVSTHFKPRYDPWDQRLCLAPDGDFFRTLRSGAASVVTDRIDRFTKQGVLTESGKLLEADLIVTATGLDLKLLGGLAFEVDGASVHFPDLFGYKGMMCTDVPNVSMALGYTNATWTLKADLTAEYVCRLLKHMDAHGYSYCCPRMNDPSIEARTMLPLSSGYIQRGRHKFPKEAMVAPWTLHQNYLLDALALRYGSVTDDAMEFVRLDSQEAPKLLKQPA